MKIFLSYYSEDKALADALGELLRGCSQDRVGVEYFKRKDGGTPQGAQWRSWILDQIKHSRKTIVLLTNASMVRPWVLYECGLAHGVALGRSPDLREDSAPLIPMSYDLQPGGHQDPLGGLEAVDAMRREDVLSLTNRLRKDPEWKNDGRTDTNFETDFGHYWNAYSATVKDLMKSSAKDNGIMSFEAPKWSDHDWLEVLTDARSEISLMGATLVGWLRNRGFKDTMRKKARTCKVRILTLSEANQAIAGLKKQVELKEDDKREQAEALAFDVGWATKAFAGLASNIEKVQHEQLISNTMNYAVALTDQCAVQFQYMRYSNLGIGPLVKSGNTDPLYAHLSKEFNALWEIAIEDRKQRSDS